MPADTIAAPLGCIRGGYDSVSVRAAGPPQRRKRDDPTSTPETAAVAKFLIERRGAVALVTLNRPQALNSLTRTMHRALQAALAQIQGDADVRALVLTGAGRGFCAGLDLSELDWTPGPDLAERANLGPVLDECFNPTARALMNLRVPTVAAANGVAAGAGVSLALLCGLVVAAPGASFVPAFSTIGLIPDAGGSWLSVERLGLARTGLGHARRPTVGGPGQGLGLE